MSDRDQIVEAMADAIRSAGDDEAIVHWLAAHDREVAVKALRTLASRANSAGLIGDPTYWFPVRDNALAEADRIERTGSDE